MAGKIYVLYPAYDEDGYHEPIASSHNRQKLVDHARDHYEEEVDGDDSRLAIQEVNII